jgi:enoyl-CoA hydratase/carnithine racemase
MSLRASREGRLLRLTLDRPEKRNALHSSDCARILDQLEQADSDRGCGAILLDAEGPSFCAGMDLEESLLPDAAERNAIHERLFTVGSSLTKPIIAAVQGHALGGGLGLAANAHVVLAAEDAQFGLPEIRIGMWPFVIWPVLVETIGARRALELSLSGRKFNAAEALAWGFVHYVVPGAELADRARKLAHEIAGASPEAVGRGMRLAQQTRGMPTQESAALAGKLRARLFQSDDFREGVRAFREKRAPRWPSLEKRDSDT